MVMRTSHKWGGVGVQTLLQGTRAQRATVLLMGRSTAEAAKGMGLPRLYASGYPTASTRRGEDPVWLRPDKATTESKKKQHDVPPKIAPKSPFNSLIQLINIYLHII
jgi:hypothetical protein